MDVELLGKDWVSGMYADVNVEGFIIKESGFFSTFQVSKIHDNALGKKLEIGSIHTIPERVFKTQDYTRINTEQQRSMIDLASTLGDYVWMYELIKKFNGSELQ